MGLRIVIDDAIPWHQEAFGHLGTVRTCKGAHIDRQVLERADALIVRSVTTVDDALLQGTDIRFVGSATAGTDHVDRAALAARDIEFAHAPGCNAQAVAEYIVAALAFGKRCRTGAPPGPVGVVGLGHVGRRVARALRAIGYDVMACDPPLAEQRARGETVEDHEPGLTNLARFERLGSLDEVFESSFVITLHVPLVHNGPHPTWHMIDADQLYRLRHGQLLINTSRGGVIDEIALRRWLADGEGKAFVDVWENEPRLDERLLSAPSSVQLATPHVAGYTLEGKLAATRMVHEGLARFMGREPDFNDRAILNREGFIDLVCDDQSARTDWRPWLCAAVPLMEDDTRLRAVMRQSAAERPAAFEQLRRGYNLRRELSAFRVRDTSLDPTTHHVLQALGIHVPRRPGDEGVPARAGVNPARGVA